MAADLTKLKSLVPAFFKTGSTPPSNIDKIFTVIETQFQEIVNNNNDLRQLSVLNAYGQTLDNYGVSLALPRNGLNDAQYRALLTAKKFGLIGGATVDEIENYFSYFLASGQTARVMPLWSAEAIAFMNGYVIYRAFSVEIAGLSPSQDAILSPALQLLKAAGIYAVINFKSKFIPGTDLPGGVWTPGTSIAARNWKTTAWTGSRFAIAGASPIIGQIITTPSTPFSPTNESHVAAFQGKLIMFGRSGSTPLIYYSTNNGSTWTACTLPGGTIAYAGPTAATISAVAQGATVSGDRIVVGNYGTNSKSILVSADGITWTNYDFTSIGGGFSTCTASEFGGLSYNGYQFVLSAVGAASHPFIAKFHAESPSSWTIQLTGGTRVGAVVFRTYGATPNPYPAGYGAIVADNLNGFGYSTDQGATWTALPGITTLYSAAYQNGIYCLHTQTGAVESTKTTTDFSTFTIAPVYVMEYINAANNYFFAGARSGGNSQILYRSADGVNWIGVSDSLVVSSGSPRVMADNGAVLFFIVATQPKLSSYDGTYEDATYFTTSADGKAWATRTIPPDNWMAIVKGINEVLVFSSYSPMVARSTDEGQTWSIVNVELSGNISFASYQIGYGLDSAYCFAGGSTYFKILKARISKSTDGGITWVTSSYTSQLNQFGKYQMFQTSAGLVVLYEAVDTTRFRVAVSTNGGTSFSYLDPAAFSAINFIPDAAAYNGSGTIMALNAAGVGALSTDGGLTWSQFAAPVAPYASLDYDSGAWIATTNHGAAVKYSYDNGATWHSATVQNDNWLSVTAQAGIFVACADDGTQGEISSRLVLP